MKTLRQYGCPRSGTNIVRIALMENFNVDVDNQCANKHGRHRGPCSMNFIICIKDPYSWLHSFFRFAQTHSANIYYQTFEEFVMSNQHTMPWVFGNIRPLQMWNQLNLHWTHEIQPCDGFKRVLVKNEDMVSRPVETVAALGELFCLTKLRDPIAIPTKRMMPYPVQYSKRDLYTTDPSRTFKSEYYTSKTYLSNYTGKLMDFMRQNLDANLVTELGYSIL